VKPKGESSRQDPKKERSGTKELEQKKQECPAACVAKTETEVHIERLSKEEGGRR